MFARRIPASRSQNNLPQLRRNEAAIEGERAGEIVQRNQDQAAILHAELSLLGQNTIEVERQVSLLRLRQEIEAEMPEAEQKYKDAVASSGACS